MDTTKHTDGYWKKTLTKEEYSVLREKGTEAPYTGKYVTLDSEGKYLCAACGNHLFDSQAKFDSSCGWPSFKEEKKGSVIKKEDNSHGMRRIEVVCSSCGGHLGHVFDDGPKPGGKRFCINSVALDFEGRR